MWVGVFFLNTVYKTKDTKSSQVPSVQAVTSAAEVIW